MLNISVVWVLDVGKNLFLGRQDLRPKLIGSIIIINILIMESLENMMVVYVNHCSLNTDC